ncbi:hypothetical protein E4U43_003864 [Claviceps pusilla]|uniref:Multicopper oxidase n=1 Tax=Claviceps pusilla TaxID=123648 RepID=A0A9P7N5G8_9HYPO|nr:hypothetical protein E4U43_003864 [Claviceps pusilla]
MAVFGGNAAHFNASALPPGSFTGCEPSHRRGRHAGQTEVIRAPRPPGRDSWMAMDLVGAFNFINAVVAIDDHDMWVYAMDGQYVQPQRVQAVAMANGERYSVMVKLRRGGRFKIRCHATSTPQMLVGHAILHVPAKKGVVEGMEEAVEGMEGAVEGIEEEAEGKKEDEDDKEEEEHHHRQWIDLVGRPLSAEVVFFDQSRAHPFPPGRHPMPRAADALHVLNMRLLGGKSYLWALNSTSLTPTELEGLDPPVLLDADGRAGAYPARRGNVTIATRNGTWVDLVFCAGQHIMPPHPIHKHGVKMFLVGSGTGPFGWSSVEQAARERPGQFNLVDPPRRDGVLSLPVGRGQESWVAVRYRVSSPGPWLLHCHIGNHMMGGMMMVILDGVDAWPDVPGEYLGTTG